jgi:hypothetical protein
MCGNSRGQKCLAKGRGKEAKYKSFCVEIKRMWNLKFNNIPVIIGATGIVKNVSRKNLEATTGKYSIDSLKIQLYLEYRILYGEYCSVKLED